ncbi:MAG: SGNH/GDSL hydrolase family protein [Blautia sp.]|nr:SGNH/GDSL hydrolase family protein [Blautia sp.]
MRTTFSTEKKYIDILKQFIKEVDVVGTERPKRFTEIMKRHTGSIHTLHPYGLDEKGLERRNPIIIAFGDSVTAGHFEFNGQQNKVLQMIQSGQITTEQGVEIVDVRESYPEKFRNKLIDKFELTSVSMVNAGIAGDNLFSMQNRLHRDVIQIQPDLVLLNASLNWGIECGDTSSFRQVLEKVVDQILVKTDADVILMTPNMEIPGPFVNKLSSLAERVACIREVAKTKKICLADTYAVWEKYYTCGYPLEKLLANGLNHPSAEAHDIFAEVLMKLF